MARLVKRPVMGTAAPTPSSRRTGVNYVTDVAEPRKGNGNEVSAVAAMEAAADDKTGELSKDGAILQRAKARFKKSAVAEQHDREEALLDLRFYVGDQWEEGLRNERYQMGRPCLTIDRIRPIVMMVVNEFKQQRPGVSVNPVGSGADVNVAEIFEGIARHIETLSDSEVAYDYAAEMMTAIGKGSFRFVFDYANDDSFDDQEMRCKKILNPFSVYWDSAAVEPDKNDALYCFVTEDMDPEEYRAEYGDSAQASLTSFTGIGDQNLWYPDGTKIRLAEYFELENKPRIKCQMVDGTVRWEDTLSEDEKPLIAKSRSVDRRQVMWYKINAVEILDRRRMPGKSIPIVTMIANEYIVGDKRITMGMIRTMRDAQRMYNIARSGAVECVMLAPRAPWVVWEGQTENHEEEWKWSNIRNMPYLTVRPVAGPDGSLLPAPTRNTWEAPIASMTQLMVQADNDLKSTSGVYDASLGNKNSVDRSGKAVEALQQQGSTATFSYGDAAARGIRQSGRVMVGAIPEIYDAPRVVRIIKPDGKAQMTPVNQHFKLVAGQDGVYSHQILEQELPGISKFYDLTVGDYDCVVAMGPNFQTKRQEAFSLLVDLAKSFPQIMQVAGDIITANWDAPFAQQLSERLKMILPPAIQAAEQQAAGEQAISPALVAQQQSQIQALSQQLQSLVQALREKKIENDAKLRMKLIDAMSGIMEAEIKAGSVSAQGLAQFNLDAAHRMVDAMMQQMQDEGDDRRLTMQQQADQQSQQMDQAHQRGMAAMTQAASQQPQAQPGA
jgi:hypothetical protein